MQQSRVVKYVEMLSPRDRDRFRQFVFSPYFNQHEKTQDLLDCILQSIDKGRELSREKLFSKLFPGEKFDEQKLHNLLSYLMKLYHRFLAAEHIQKRPFVEELFTLEEAFELNHFDLMLNRARQLEKHLEAYQSRDAHFHYVQFRLNNLLGYYTTSMVNRTFSPNLQHMLDHLDRYYLVAKLRNCCHLTANMMMMNTNYDFAFFDLLLKEVQQLWEIYGNEPSINLYYTILMSLREEQNPEHYNRLKELMATRFDLFAPEERTDLYGFSYNYCIRQINFGNHIYQRELFQLYQQGLRNGLLISNGYLDEWTYKNIVTLTCQLREFEWTENFLEEYRHKLPANRQENAYFFNLATLYYSKKMYDQTLSVLQQVQFTDYRYHLNRNSLMLRTYYAINDTEVLLSHIEAFRIYVIRNRNLRTDEKRSYINFLRFAKKLVLLRHQAGAYSKKNLLERLTTLEQQIRNAGNVMHGSWLLSECLPEKADDFD